MDNNNNNNQKIAKPKVQRRKVSISKLDDVLNQLEVEKTQQVKKEKKPKQEKEPKTPRGKSKSNNTVLIEPFPENEMIDLNSGYCPNPTQMKLTKQQPVPSPSQTVESPQYVVPVKSTRKQNSWIDACLQYHKRSTDTNAKFIIPKKNTPQYEKIKNLQIEMARRCAF